MKTGPKPKTHCKLGHELTPENTCLSAISRSRKCIICKNSENRVRYLEDPLYKLKQDVKVRARTYARKIRVLTHYGKDGRLMCCWEGCSISDPDMLSLDHINNDGAEDRRQGKTGTSLYLRVERDGYREDLQTLCHNHQWKKEFLRRRVLHEASDALLKSLVLD
jgi:hypothetical protein